MGRGGTKNRMHIIWTVFHIQNNVSENSVDLLLTKFDVVSRNLINLFVLCCLPKELDSMQVFSM